MGNPVFANGMEISSKAMGGKSICAFPDVCFTPPQTPGTPPGVPLPYPNTGLAGDCTDGSSSVKIGGEEVMLKNKSYFKQSSGNEAGCAPKKGVATSKIKGKVYFTAWSMDVMVEGENVVRHLDLTTHNHGSNTNTATWPHVAQQALNDFDNCSTEKEAIKNNCKDDGSDQCPGALSVNVENQQKEWVRVKKKGRGWQAKAKTIAKATNDAMAHHDGSVRKDQSATQNAASMASQDANACVKAMRCFLRPKSPNEDQTGCCPGQTPNHIPPDTYFEGKKKYQYGQALCVCLEGMNQHFGTHGDNHALIDHLAETHDLKDAEGASKGPLAKQRPAKLNDAITVSSLAVAEQCGCKKECIEEQLNKHFQETQKLPPATTNVKYQKIASRASIDKVPARIPNR